VHALERQLADLRRRQAEAERERERASEQLADREHELRRVKQREYAEQQLRVEAEENVARLRRRHRSELNRLQRRVEEAHAAMQATGERAEELRVRAEQARLEAERRYEEAERRRANAEQERTQAERRCATLAARLAVVGDGCTRLREGILVLEGAVAALRAEVEHERGAARPRIEELEQACAASDARVRELERALGSAGGVGLAGARGARREEMAGALAAAVERLRARVAAVEETDAVEELETSEADASVRGTGLPEGHSRVSDAPEGPSAKAPTTRIPGVAAQAESAAVHAAVQIVPRQLPPPTHRDPWLARAIRGVAEHRGPKLAAELVGELLPAQRLVVEHPLSYGLRIAELDGRLRARLGYGQADVGPLPVAEEAELDFELRGRAADFAELAAGGAGRRLAGLEIHGSRRRARALRRARRRPLTLWDLADAGIDVWPGLLLLALAEAIDPRWSIGRRFTVAFEIEPAGGDSIACAPATLNVQARDGAPLTVLSSPREPPLATVRVGERAFMCMLAGAPLPAGERILVEGETGPLELLIEWADRAQGRSSARTGLRRSRA
jgi:hypothetical protein